MADVHMLRSQGPSAKGPGQTLVSRCGIEVGKKPTDPIWALSFTSWESEVTCLKCKIPTKT